jgi:SPW repeat
MKRLPRTRSWIDVTNLLLAGLLICLPSFFTSAGEAAAWNASVVAGLIGFNAGLALLGAPAWEEWTNVVLGLWVAASPWLFHFQTQAGSTWSYLILGCAIAACAALQLWLAYRGPRPDHPGLSAGTPAS